MTNEDIGDPRGEFGPSTANILAGVILGMLMIGLGGTAIYAPIKDINEGDGTLPAWKDQPLTLEAVYRRDKVRSWGVALIVWAVGGALVAGGILMIRYVKRLASLQVYLGSKGFSVTEKNISQTVAWEEVASVQEVHHYSRPKKLWLKYAMAPDRDVSFRVILKQGKPFTFDANSIKKYMDLARMIKKETDPRHIPWEVVEEYGHGY